MLRVKELMELKSFQGSKCIAGSAGLIRSVEDISVMEVPDIEDYVNQGEFLVTTLYPLYGNEEKMKTLITRLNAAGLSGLGIKINRYISDVPDYFITQANDNDFPLLILPENSNLSILMNEFLKETNHQKSMELEYRNTIHEKLMECMLEGKEYSGLAETLGKLLKRNAALFDKDMNKLGTYLDEEGESVWEQEITGSSSLIYQEDKNQNFCKIPLRQGCSILYRVQYGSEKIGYIILYSSDEFNLTELEKISIEQFSIVFRILIQRQKVIAELENRYIEGFTCDLLFGKITNDSNASSRANALGWKMTFPMAVLLIDIINLPDRIKDKVEVIHVLKNRIRSDVLLTNMKWSCFFACNERYIVGFMDLNAYDHYDKICDRIQYEFERLKISSYYMAVSRTANTVLDISKCYEEGERTLDIARMLNRREVLHYRNIGIYRMIHAAKSKSELREYCLDTIGTLIRYDKEHNACLLQTLGVILEQSGNLKEASKKLFIHYNTIRYRFRLIEEILHKKLDTISDYHDLNLAVKIYYFLHLDRME